MFYSRFSHLQFLVSPRIENVWDSNWILEIDIRPSEILKQFIIHQNPWVIFFYSYSTVHISFITYKWFVSLPRPQWLNKLNYLSITNNAKLQYECHNTVQLVLDPLVYVDAIVNSLPTLPAGCRVWNLLENQHCSLCLLLPPRRLQYQGICCKLLNVIFTPLSFYFLTWHQFLWFCMFF